MSYILFYTHFGSSTPKGGVIGGGGGGGSRGDERGGGGRGVKPQEYIHAPRLTENDL